MATKNTYPVGLKLPLTKGNGGYFDQNFSTLDQAHTNIKNLLLTIISERRLNVNFGSKIPSLLFEQVTSEEEFIENFKTYITESINNFFPYVTIEKINTSFDKNNPNKLNTEIIFKLKNYSDSSFTGDETKELTLYFNLNI